MAQARREMRWMQARNEAAELLGPSYSAALSPCIRPDCLLPPAHRGREATATVRALRHQDQPITHTLGRRRAIVSCVVCSAGF